MRNQKLMAVNLESGNLGVFFYERCVRNKKASKLNDDEWWYIMEGDIMPPLAKPTEEKLSGLRKVFYFSDIPSASE